MRIALVHDYIKEYGGAERVLEALHEIWPDAPVYTSIYLPEFLGPHKARFKNWDIRTSWAQHLPFRAKLISPLRLIAPWIFKSFDLSKFDVVIVSATGAYSPNSISCHPELVSPRQTRFQDLVPEDEMPKRVRHDTVKRPIHICYSHTPPRYLYGYATARDWKKNILLRIFGEIANHFLRLVDFKSAQNVDYFIANSKNIAGRIKKFYRRSSFVVYPPVGGPAASFPPAHLRQDYGGQASASAALPLEASKRSGVGSPPSHATPFYLAGGRIAKPKHIDLIVKTFVKLGLPLKVFGRTFAGHDSLFMIHNSNIEFLGEVSDEEKLELMRNAKAFVFAAEDEDFGITPVEAMSVGTPVIAFASGGVLETVIDGKTGILFRFNDLNHLSEAVRKFEKMKFDREFIIKHAEKFSKERFKKEILTYIMKVV